MVIFFVETVRCLSTSKWGFLYANADVLLQASEFFLCEKIDILVQNKKLDVLVQAGGDFCMTS